MQQIIDAYYDTVLASMSDAPLPAAAPCDTDAHPYILPPEGAFRLAAPIAGKVGENSFGLTGIAVREEADGLVLTLTGAGTVEVPCGAGEWEYTDFAHFPITPGGFLGSHYIGTPARIASAWAQQDGCVEIVLQFVSSPHGLILELDESSLTVEKTLDHVSHAKTVLKFL